jgi:BlaI family penicillinase repressor
MPEKTHHITPAELEVMKALWKLGSATVQQTLDALAAENDQTPAYTTVMTMMQRLADKDVLDVDRTRQPFIFTPAVRKEKILKQRLSQFLQTVFDGQVEDLILHLADATDLSAEALQRIESKIKKRAAEESRKHKPADKKETRS